MYWLWCRVWILECGIHTRTCPWTFIGLCMHAAAAYTYQKSLLIVAFFCFYTLAPTIVCNWSETWTEHQLDLEQGRAIVALCLCLLSAPSPPNNLEILHALTLSCSSHDLERNGILHYGFRINSWQYTFASRSDISHHFPIMLGNNFTDPWETGRQFGSWTFFGCLLPRMCPSTTPRTFCPDVYHFYVQMYM